MIKPSELELDLLTNEYPEACYFAGVLVSKYNDIENKLVEALEKQDFTLVDEVILEIYQAKKAYMKTIYGNQANENNR